VSSHCDESLFDVAIVGHQDSWLQTCSWSRSSLGRRAFGHDRAVRRAKQVGLKPRRLSPDKLETSRERHQSTGADEDRGDDASRRGDFKAPISAIVRAVEVLRGQGRRDVEGLIADGGP
jgi:hypothetical protein